LIYQGVGPKPAESSHNDRPASERLWRSDQTFGRFAAAGSRSVRTDVTRALAAREREPACDRIHFKQANAIYYQRHAGGMTLLPASLGAGAATILAGAGNDIRVVAVAGSDTINGGSGDRRNWMGGERLGSRSQVAQGADPDSSVRLAVPASDGSTVTGLPRDTVIL